jgi:alpha,alpha-trehalase
MAQTELQKINPLFEDVQLSRIFPDGKTFVDCIPKHSIEDITAKYLLLKERPEFTLKDFVLENFDLPSPPSSLYQSNPNKSVQENIEALWDILTRQPDKEGGSLIPLPYPYIVPGGRFGEIYYWDSYFTMLGLKVSGRYDMIENMINNFSYLIDKFGYIPNGNRSYFTGRSQPPFYSLMIQLLSGIKARRNDPSGQGKITMLTYLPQLEKEYSFWMKGSEELNETKNALQHALRMPDGEILNRYWDENNTARPESFREDVQLSHQYIQESKKLFRHLRAGAESGWDYSSRWFKDADSFHSIHTTDIIPVDLNCLLFHLEKTIAEACQLNGETAKEKKYFQLAEKRRMAIEKYCWNDSAGFYVDYDWVNNCQKLSFTLAGISPLFFNLATDKKANQVAAVIKEKFLFPGGVVSTLETTGQQWDAPNGWAPLHWMTITGLENYGYTELAAAIANRWIKLNTDIFKRTGKLMEKYNVMETHLEAGGGEYPGQDGFGWTNGVLLALIAKYGAMK